MEIRLSRFERQRLTMQNGYFKPKLAKFIFQSQKIVVFTGAGISTESGISDYRSKGGIWDRFQPVTIQEFLASEEKRIEYWKTKSELYESFLTAKPNKGHFSIAKIQQVGKLRGLITQNIDGLHQMAGVDQDKTCELHGTNRETICLSCSALTSWQETFQRLKAGEKAPRCLACNGLLKPNTISFGQTLDPVVLQRSVEWSRDCDFLLALGSTLIVEPAASLPRLAKRAGAKLVIITLSPTPLDDLADVSLKAPIGETMGNALEEFERLYEKSSH